MFRFAHMTNLNLARIRRGVDKGHATHVDDGEFDARYSWPARPRSTPLAEFDSRTVLIPARQPLRRCEFELPIANSFTPVRIDASVQSTGPARAVSGKGSHPVPIHRYLRIDERFAEPVIQDEASWMSVERAFDVKNDHSHLVVLGFA